jgi:hypothetical protein
VQCNSDCPFLFFEIQIVCSCVLYSDCPFLCNVFTLSCHMQCTVFLSCVLSCLVQWYIWIVLSCDLYSDCSFLCIVIGLFFPCPVLCSAFLSCVLYCLHFVLSSSMIYSDYPFLCSVFRLLLLVKCQIALVCDVYSELSSFNRSFFLVQKIQIVLPWIENSDC